MNGCVFFNRSVSRLVHAVAIDMGKRYQIKNWSVYAYGRSSYELATNNPDIKYQNILVDDFLIEEGYKEKVDNEWLQKKEIEYGTPFLWPTFMADRGMIHNWPKKFYVDYNPVFSHEQIKQQLQIRIRKIEEFLDATHPDFVIMNAVCGMGSMLLYFIARKHGIKVIIFEMNRINDHVTLTESIYGTYPSVDGKFLSIRNGAYVSPLRSNAEKWLMNFRNRPTRPSYIVRPFEQSTISSINLFVKNFLRKFTDSFNSFPRFYDYSPWSYIKRNFLMWMNTHVRMPRFDEPDFHEDYAFFPLHYDPELSTMVYAPYFTDQIWLIKSIAQSLPINMKLYVKEHPTMVGLRSLAYYREIQKIPNVRLINPDVNSIEIIKHTKIALLISSTVGWEALLLGKPVVTFGSVFYNALSIVTHCTAIEQLPTMVKDLLQKTPTNDGELIDFISAMLEESIDINLDTLWYREKDVHRILANPELQKFSDAIMNTCRQP